MEELTRRKFFLGTLLAGIAAGARGVLGAEPPGAAPLPAAWPQAAAAKSARPLIISSANGIHALGRGMEILKNGGDTLDAVLAVVNVVEDDPNDDSVGYGGLPNEDGDVELDACVMHGPTRRAGSVASIRQIKNPSKVARAVMERTNHVMLAGPGALRFAQAEGFEPMNLLTDRSRLAWLAWKAQTTKNWAPGLDSPEWKEKLATILDTPERMAWADHIREVVLRPPTGTINCMAVNQKGDISGTTTTSGLAWKIAGRVGDSPIIGAGLYLDNDIGAAGSTGKGEENIKVAGGHTIVEMMRKGLSPTDACLEALHRISRNYNNDKRKLEKFHVFFYALNKDGVHGSAALWEKSYDGKSRARYAVDDGSGAREAECAYLYPGGSVED